MTQYLFLLPLYSVKRRKLNNNSSRKTENNPRPQNSWKVCISKHTFSSSATNTYDQRSRSLNHQSREFQIKGVSTFQVGRDDISVLDRVAASCLILPTEAVTRRKRIWRLMRRSKCGYVAPKACWRVARAFETLRTILSASEGARYP